VSVSFTLVASKIGLTAGLVEQEGTGSIQLTAEDYLQGVIGMVNELVNIQPFHTGETTDMVSKMLASFIDQFGDCTELFPPG